MNVSAQSGCAAADGCVSSCAAADGCVSDRESASLTLYIVNVYVDGLLCVVGLCGNLLTVLVLQRQGVRTSNAVLLQALAGFDCCFLIYAMLYVVLRSADLLTEVNQYIVAIVLPLGWTAQTATIWTAMAIVIDRFLIVSRPLRAPQWCTVRRARHAAVGIAVAAVLYNAVRWPRYYYVAFYSSDHGNTTFVSHLSASIEDWGEETYMKVYHIGLTLVFVFILPLSVIVSLNLGLIYHLTRATKSRKLLTASAAQPDKMARARFKVNTMVVVLITIFVVCELPDFIAAIIGAGQFKKDPNTYTIFAVFKECLLILNSSINFFIYIIFYTRFRKQFQSMLCCRQKSSGSSISSTERVTPSSVSKMSISSVDRHQSTGTGLTLTPI